MAQTQVYKDDEINVVERDIDKMRNRPTMYLSSLNAAGCLHVCKELIDNSRDECGKKDSPGNEIHLEIFNDHITVSDNGRGIPTNLLQIVHETNQAGSNMTRSGGSTVGENGTGTTLAVATASKLIVTTFRPTEKKCLTLMYEEGVLVEKKESPYKAKFGGLTTTYYPSKKILGVKNIPVDDLLEWVKDMDYTLPKSTKFVYSYNKKEYTVNHKTLLDYLNEHVIDIKDKDGEELSKFMCDPISIKASGKLKEIFNEQTFNRSFNVECMFVYTNPIIKDDDIRKSWMNMIYTSLNGTHMDGCINGFARAMKELVIRKKKQLEGESIKRDILSHLQVILKATCDFAHMFSSQGKHHVFPENLGKAIEDAVYEEIMKMPVSKLDTMVDVIIANNRVRKEGEKARDINKQTKTRNWEKITSFIPCASIRTPEPKELFLVEGLSAGGGLRNARDARYQAILQFKGKNLNVWDCDLNRTMQSETWLNLVKVLGCGIGPTFDIKKLKFDKIIITSDADPDGKHIRVQFLSFFLKYMPEIITEGHLFMAEPPLYGLKDGKNMRYVSDKSEYIEVCINSISDIQIEFPEVV